MGGLVVKDVSEGREEREDSLPALALGIGGSSTVSLDCRLTHLSSPAHGDTVSKNDLPGSSQCLQVQKQEQEWTLLHHLTFS